MANLNPKQTEEFLEKRFKPQGEVSGELAKKAIGVKLPVEIDQAVRALPDTSAWLRRVITEAAQRELIQGSNTKTGVNGQ